MLNLFTNKFEQVSSFGTKNWNDVILVKKANFMLDCGNQCRGTKNQL